jgi:hypothetical protein
MLVLFSTSVFQVAEGSTGEASELPKVTDHVDAPRSVTEEAESRSHQEPVSDELY